jgi:hypothetical protein
VCLQTVLEVVKTAVIAYFSRHHAREIGDAISKEVPEAGVLFGGCVWWWFDWMALFDEGVEVDHLGVGAERLHDGLARDARREGCEGREDGAFRHLELLE